jgi:hypothetical protein
LDILKYKRYSCISLILVILVTYFSIGSNSVLANSGLAIAPFESIKADVSPGQILTHKMKLTLGEQNNPMDISVDTMGYSISADGMIQAIEASQDASPFSARSFIKLDSQILHLEPGKSEEVSATISLPNELGSGGKYAIIYIHQVSSTGSGATSSISAFNIPILLTVKDSQIIHTAKINRVEIAEAISGEPINIYTTFQNTGNHHYKVKAEISIFDANSRILDKLNVSLTPNPIIPTMYQQLKCTFIPEMNLAPGIYTTKSRIMLEDSTLLDEATGSFEVKAPYVPPPPPAQVALKPSSAATLNTDDGRIFINFPQGAVLGETTVSLRSFSPDQLPAAPNGYKAATTCFRVDGLTGLLTKDAKMTVKYSTADLEKAGGDPSKLQLARWDEASNQWTVLKTTVDKSAMTLTVNTNQFSLWAVMIGAPVSTAGSVSLNLYIIIFGIAALAIAVLIIVLWMKRRKVRTAR